MMSFKKTLVPIIIILLAASLVSTAGCQLIAKVQPSPTTSTTVAPTQTATPVSHTVIDNATPLSSLTLPSFADIVAQVKPSVVAINTEVTAYGFFNRTYTQQGAGSGWIIDPNGLIITNNHVIAGAQTVSVTLIDGSTYPVDIKTIKYDSVSDLAVLQINATGLPALKVGDSSKLREGDWVLAIGNSLGEGIRVTQGIVSRQNVSMTSDTGETLEGLIETNAVINPGNSGGPLFNLAGQVIGITNAKRVATGIEGVGYAISSNEAMPVINLLITVGHVARPWFEVDSYTVDALAINYYRLRVNTGVVITNVVSGSPADQAGLQEGDVIVRFNGQDITAREQLVQAKAQTKIGQEVEVTYWRGNNQKTIKVVMGESPPS